MPKKPTDAERIAILEADLVRERARIANVERVIADLVAEGPFIDGDREDPKAYSYWIGQRETLALFHAAFAGGAGAPMHELIAEAERHYRTPVADDLALEAYYRNVAEIAMQKLTREKAVVVRPSDWDAIVGAASAGHLVDRELPIVECVRRVIFADKSSWR